MIRNWCGGRNGYMDQDGEYQPSAGYRFYRSVHDRVLMSDPYRLTRCWSLSIKVELDVDESCAREYPYKSRVSGWRLRLIVEGTRSWSCLASGKTTSLQSAIRQAETWLANNDPVSIGLAWFYDRKETTTVVDGDIELVTFFHASSYDYMSLPKGDYSLSRPGVETQWLRRCGCGCSWGHSPARDQKRIGGTNA